MENEEIMLRISNLALFFVIQTLTKSETYLGKTAIFEITFNQVNAGIYPRCSHHCKLSFR